MAEEKEGKARCEIGRDTARDRVHEGTLNTFTEIKPNHVQATEVVIVVIHFILPCFFAEVPEMGDKEVKAFLKEAREQIKNKDFKSALKECRKVINKDKNNYMALVFCGLSLSELDQPDQAIQVSAGMGW